MPNFKQGSAHKYPTNHRFHQLEISITQENPSNTLYWLNFPYNQQQHLKKKQPKRSKKIPKPIDSMKWYQPRWPQRSPQPATCCNLRIWQKKKLGFHPKWCVLNCYTKSYGSNIYIYIHIYFLYIDIIYHNIYICGIEPTKIQEWADFNEWFSSKMWCVSSGQHLERF